MEIQSASPALHTLRVALLGDATVGKKTFMQKLAKKQNEYISSPEALHLCENQLSFHLQSNSGPCQVTLVFFNIDLEHFQANQKYCEQVCTKLKTCSNALLMFSLLDRNTYKRIPEYFRTWARANQEGLSLLISTKADDGANIKIRQKQIMFHRKKNIDFFNVSSKAAYNLLAPFAYFFRKSLKNKDFVFIEPQNYVSLQPEVEFLHKQQIQAQKKEASTCQLPEVDDDGEF